MLANIKIHINQDVDTVVSSLVSHSKGRWFDARVIADRAKRSYNSGQMVEVVIPPLSVQTLSSNPLP